MQEKLLLLLNPCAGQRRANRFLPEIIRLYNDRGYDCICYVTAGNGDATRYLEQRAADFDRIVCIGGDGTLNETIAGLLCANVDCPVGYIPAGTTNDYASSLGLSSDIMHAAADAVDGKAFRFDLGLFNGRSFIYTASCGAFARTSYTTPQLSKNLLGHLAYVLEGIKDLPTLKPIHVKATVGERVYEDEYIFCSVTNSVSVGGILKLDRDLVRLNDGVFEVLLVKNPTTPAQWTRVIAALTSSELNNEMIDFFTADSIRIETAEDVEWTLDGERGECGRTFEVQNLHQRIALMLPEAAEATLPIEGKQDAELSD